MNCDVSENEKRLKAVGVDPDSIGQVQCDDCGRVGSIEDLVEPVDLQRRVDPGGEVPAGECPECGALAYPIDSKKGDDEKGAIQRALEIEAENREIQARQYEEDDAYPEDGQAAEWHDSRATYLRRLADSLS